MNFYSNFGSKSKNITANPKHYKAQPSIIFMLYFHVESR